MIAFNQNLEQQPSDWQTGFIELFPEIQQRLRHAFRHRDVEAREEAVAAAVALCLLSYLRLHGQGRTATVTASSLAWFAAKQVRSGRTAVGRLNSQEPLSHYAQLRHGIRVEPMGTDDGETGNWIVAIVADRRASVPDQVAARIDFADWFATLPARLAAIAKDLSFGYSTSETAQKFRVSCSRISQLRRTLEESWMEFQREPAIT